MSGQVPVGALVERLAASAPPPAGAPAPTASQISLKTLGSMLLLGAVGWAGAELARYAYSQAKGGLGDLFKDDPEEEDDEEEPEPDEDAEDEA